MVDTYKGSCFCGEIEFEVTGTPVVMGYCHCDDCTTWLAAPISAMSLWAPDNVQITKGEASVGTFNRTEHAHRKFCSICGGHLMTDHPGMKLVDVYTRVLQGFTHEPSVHVHYGKKTISVKDGLPKFKDLPTDYGGSGEMLAE